MQILQGTERSFSGNRSQSAQKLLGVFTGIGASLPGKAGVHLVEMVLKALFGIIGHTREFDPHPYSWISSAHRGGGRNTLLIDPEVDPQDGRNRQRHDCLNITAVATDVSGIDSHGSVDPLVAEFKRKRDAVTQEPSAIVRERRRLVEPHLGRQLGHPGALLVSHQLHSYLNLL